MKFEKGALICGLLFMILLGVVSAESTCAVRSGECLIGESAIVKLSSVQNAHGELASQNNYDNILCCFGISSTVCSGTNEILRLSGTTNAHAESPALNYDNNYRVCATGLSCVTATGSCPSGKNAVLSLYSSTNSHLASGENSNYNIKICCDVPIVDIPTFCGDGEIQNPNDAGEVETCDDNNNQNRDGCSGSCKKEFCGDGIITTSNREGYYIGDSIPEECESPTLNCVPAGQTGECKCASGYELKKGLCVKIPSFTPWTCSDISTDNYDNADIQDIVGLCNEFDPQQTRDINNNPSIECLIDLKCSWDNNKCNTIDGNYAEGYSADDENCKEIPKLNCIWIPNTDETCGEGVNIITMTYTKDPLSTNCNETDFTNTVPCPEINMLPFFGFYQVIISLSIISIIYVLMIVRGRKD